MFYMQSASVNFTTATYFHLTLPCFLTLLFLTSSQTKVNTLFFQLSIWNTTNRNTYRHKSFQFKLKAYNYYYRKQNDKSYEHASDFLPRANRTYNQPTLPSPPPTSMRSLLLTAPKMLCSKFKSFSTLHKKEATILLSRCRQPTLKPSFSLREVWVRMCR